MTSTLKALARRKAAQTTLSYCGLDDEFTVKMRRTLFKEIELVLLSFGAAVLESVIAHHASRFRSMHDGENELAKKIYVAERKDFDSLKKSLERP